MSFYSDFAVYYEAVFPLDETVYTFLRDAFGPGARSVLDIGCGTGDYCGRLADDGLTALGIDSDEEMIAAASSSHAGADFRTADAREVASIGGPFDAVFSIGNTVAHIPHEDLPGFARGVRAALSEGGVWVMQTVNWDSILERTAYEFPVVVLEGGDVRFERRYPSISPERVRFEIRLSRGGETLFGGSVWLYPVRASRYVEIHEACGFSLAAHRGDFAGSPFDPRESGSSVFVFRGSGAARSSEAEC